jgi:hypothetical protein
MSFDIWRQVEQTIAFCGLLRLAEGKAQYGQMLAG